jgi:hypothetical protein
MKAKSKTVIFFKRFDNQSSCIGLSIALTLLLSTGCTSMTKPDGSDEKREIMDFVATRIGQKMPTDTHFQSTGAFRFAGAQDILFIERTDTGSIAFEVAEFGLIDHDLIETEISKDVLLPKIEDAIHRVGLPAEGRQFDYFQDEYAGTVQPATVNQTFDPRKVSKHVARSAVYVRTLKGIPVFSSELIVGLMPNGGIGRLRLHWPVIEVGLIDDAIVLQQLLKSGKWRLPDQFKDPGIERLEIIAGIHHSGFASPVYKARSVVRVQYRKTGGRGTKYQTSSTGYMYFDKKGNEIYFDQYPTIPGTKASAKK